MRHKQLVTQDPLTTHLLVFGFQQETCSVSVFYKENLNPFFQVWPGLTAYPDFSDNVTHEWWYENLQRFHEKVPFDGLWIVSMEMEDTI